VKELENLTVLVADDEQDACESACCILNEIGMVADWVLSGAEAVERVLKAHSECKDYSVIILDWKMPEMNGLETAKRIRQKVGSEIPIIILSAFDYSAIEQEAREAGVNAFISKPMFRSRLIYVMKSLMLGEEMKDKELDELQTRDYTGKRILLVEDNALNMEIGEELLKRVGVMVEKAVDGREAVDKVNAMPEEYYDLIFMDIQMPVMNGYEAAKQIRASKREDLRKIPIVAMSADAFADDVAHAREVGMNEHISKPVEISKLLKILDDWIA
jgi:CheY-like chemotaxis protein